MDTKFARSAAAGTVRVDAWPCFEDRRGNLTFAQQGAQIPFAFGRVRWGWRRYVADGEAVAVPLRGSVEADGSVSVSPSSALIFDAGEHSLTTDAHSIGLLIEPGEADPSHNPEPRSHGDVTAADCRLIEIECDSDGSWSVDCRNSPGGFDICRLYYIYAMPAAAIRGGHSHHREQRLLIAAAGAFDVHVDDGREIRTFRLDNPGVALYIPPGLWRTLDNFEPDSVALALCSNLYSADDYVRHYSKFKQLTINKG